MIAECNSDLEKYFYLKKNVQLPVKARLYFLIFENALDHNKTNHSIESKKGFSKALLGAFSNLSQDEKGKYLLSSISFVLDQLDRQEKEKTKADSKVENDEIRQVQTTCDMLLSTLKIHYWATVSLKLDKIKKLLSVTNKKKSFAIDMMNYFVRRSKKYKHSIVLEATTDEINNQAKKYIFCFNHQIVNKIHEQMLKCCFVCQNQKLLSLLVEDDEDQRDERHNLANNDKALVFLNSKNINQYLAYKERVEKQIMQNKFQFRTLLIQGLLRIEQSSKFEKVFRMQNTFQVDAKELKEKFIFAFDHNNKFVVDLQILQQFSKKYKAVYEKLSLRDRTYEYISIREESLSTQEEVLFVKGVENIMGKNYIEFIQARVRTLNPCLSKLIVYLSIGLSTVITRDVVKMFMMEFNDMVFRKKEKADKIPSLQVTESQPDQEEEEDDFKTVKGSQQFVGYIEDNSENNGLDLDLQTSNHGHEKGDDKKRLSYLFNQHIQTPVEDEKYRRLMTEHYLFREWKRIKGGGVVCTNQQQVNNQKSLFKTGLAKMGKGILKGELLRISLPVIIFRKESHLESIARNFCYAPMFFDKLAKQGNPVERVKYASLLAVSVGTLGISLLKPFNPILGETIQLWIDGCPMYLEQISHHPPIGAYYFVGRGFRMYGQIEPRISFGLNNIKGFSSRPNYIEFQDGTVIEMSFGKMVIKGLLFGEREFNFQDKIFAFDRKNCIFSQIIYGPRKRGKGKESHDPSDFIHGTIYKVTGEFGQKFAGSEPRIFPTKSQIISALSRFEGVWNDEIMFDGKPYVNFAKDLPSDLVAEEHPLLSNSSYRTDLLKLIHSTLDEAQKEKDWLEELQRRDNKLREKFR